MAEKIVFKQQCPSCEAMVPIKDMKLVGRKIDCPKCKYRFVVEEPEKEEEDTEGEEQPQEATTAKRPASGKGASDQAKSGKKRPRDQEDEDEDRPRKKGKKKSSGKDSSKLYLGLGLAVVAVVLLAVAGFFMLGGEKKPPVGPLAGTGGVENPGDDTTKKENPKTTPGAEAAVVDVSNLLPNDSEMVLNVSIPDFLKSPLGETAFGTPGAFQPNSFKDTLGFNERDVDRYLLAANHTQDWLFQVIRLGQAADVEAVKKALRLTKPKDSPVQGQDYFVTEYNWIENGSPLRPAGPGVKPAANLPGSRLLAVRFLDGNKTLVLADLVPMKQFLASKGQPSLLSQPAAAPAPAAGAAPPAPAAPAAEPNAAPAASNSYLSVKPTLKAMLDRLEAGRPVVFSLANDMQADKGLLKPLAATLGVQVPLNELGLSAAQTKEAIVCAAGMECASEEVAKNLNAQLRPRLEPLIALGAIVNIKVQIPTEQAPMGTPPPPPPASGTGTPAPPAEASATIRLTQSAKSVQLTAELVPNPNAMGILYPVLGRFWIDLKGQADMAMGRSGIHTLALAGRGYADEHKQFPRGTFERIKKGINLPYPPDQRVSWMAELLPYLGHEDLHGSIDYQSSWRDGPNLNAAFTLVPEFLAPQSPSEMWRVRYPGLDTPVAATHFVGIAGVGLDAASYSAANPALANKLGIFGYDRITKMQDIKDGASNTIFMVQVPPTYKSPWLAGGGSTVRGVPDSKSIQPFVCTERDGKRGTYVLMADGSVRWLSDTISDDVFKAMCTISGGETPTNLDGLAPKIPAPAGQTTMRPQATLPVAPPMKKP